ncbi:MAG TPA: phosphoribosylanthranilate isomerase [Micavibrio sp.]|nr:phosphoribosylanthranilate isomerase [Micavibrio sp.]
MTTQVKICGLKTPAAMTAALEEEADFVGLVFHPASPRHLEIEIAAYLADYVPDSVKVCGLFVDPPDDILTRTLENVRIDMIQLHGHESPERTDEIRQVFKKPVIKALSLSSHSDLTPVDRYQAADWLLLDAKGTAEIPGGTGRVFDWSILNGFERAGPWMLAGGLTPENVGEAISLLRPNAVDVSSGVESARGVKDPDKIRAFLRAARTAV